MRKYVDKGLGQSSIPHLVLQTHPCSHHNLSWICSFMLILCQTLFSLWKFSGFGFNPIDAYTFRRDAHRFVHGSTYLPRCAGLSPVVCFHILIRRIKIMPVFEL